MKNAGACNFSFISRLTRSFIYIAAAVTQDAGRAESETAKYI